jgi:hypothetical protein
MPVEPEEVAARLVEVLRRAVQAGETNEFGRPLDYTRIRRRCWASARQRWMASVAWLAAIPRSSQMRLARKSRIGGTRDNAGVAAEADRRRRDPQHSRPERAVDGEDLLAASEPRTAEDAFDTEGTSRRISAWLVRVTATAGSSRGPGAATMDMTSALSIDSSAAATLSAICRGL